MQVAQQFLDAAPLIAKSFVRHVEVHGTVGSTNDRAAELAGQLPAENLPALVAARHQSAGRGRGRNAWWSADGALTFSLVLDPSASGIAQAKWPQLSLAAAVAVCDAVQKHIVGNEPKVVTPERLVSVKWPNDVMLDGRKVAGILLESRSGGGPAKDRLVIGIGINVNNSCREAPGTVAERASALCDVSGLTHNLQRVLGDVLSALEHRIGQLSRGDTELSQEWNRRSLLTGMRVNVAGDGGIVAGTCVRIAEDGALIVDTLGGRRLLYSGTPLPA
jgi:BirA family biotin operon repressor/biotin-[acetyl-CoA-carboxylase] ligase